jgi:hypothetical protein
MLTNISDYLANNPNVNVDKKFIDLDNDATNWHDNLQAGFNSIRTDETPNTDVFIEYPTGWYWINLNTEYSDDESKNMGHCGRDKGKILFSLRDHEKQSHITVSYSEDYKSVYQIKGKKNSKPKTEYHQYIIDMLLNTTYEVNFICTGSYKPELDFNLQDLTEEQRKNIISKKPTFEYTDKILNNYLDNENWDMVKSMINNGFNMPNNINLDKIKIIDNDFWFNVLKTRVEAIHYLNNIDNETYIKAIKIRPRCVLKLKNPTNEMYLLAVQKDGMILIHIPEDKKNMEMCLLAVKNDGDAIQGVPVKYQTEELCIIAVEKSASSITYIENQTEKVCLSCVKNDPLYLLWIKEENQTEEVCLNAIKGDSRTIKFVKNEELKNKLEKLINI